MTFLFTLRIRQICLIYAAVAILREAVLQRFISRFEENKFSLQVVTRMVARLRLGLGKRSGYRSIVTEKDTEKISDGQVR